MTRSIHVQANRQHLLAGISSLILAATLVPTTAAAQTNADGRTVIVTTQRSQNAAILASRTSPPVSIATGDLADTTVSATDTTLDVKAGANSTTSDSTSLPLTRTSVMSSGSVLGDTVNSDAGLAIATQQTVRGGSVASSIAGGTTISAGNISTSTATIARDQSNGSAFGNANTAGLRDDTGAGAGIVSAQSVLGAPVDSTLSGRIALTAGRLDDGRIQIDANGQSSTATGNTSDLGLTATVADVASSGRDHTTHAVDDSAEVDAAELLVQRQAISSATTAVAGTALAPSGTLATVETVDHGTIGITGNQLSADAAGNRATASLDVEGATITHDGSIAGSLVMQAADGNVTASTYGGSAATVAGQFDTSSLLLSGNGVVTSARGNVASNAMTVKAAETHASTGLEGGPIGTALTHGSGDRSTSAAYAVHTDQTVGAVDITTEQHFGGAAAALSGRVTGSTVTLTGNAASADAVANQGKSTLSIEAPVFLSSADLLSSQSSDASLHARLGDGDMRAGATITPWAGIDNSRLTIDGNTLRADAVANRTSNALSLTSASANDGGDHPTSVAGTLDSGYGAAATLALASVQKVGDPALPRPAIDAQILGRFSVTGEGGARGSSIDITANRQQASAGANSADNSLILTAASTSNAGTSLSNAQFGDAALSAISAFKAVAPGSLDTARVSITDNANAAIATMNDAANSLAVSGTPVASFGTAVMVADPLGGASAMGDHVLANAQFSQGSVDARALLVLAASPDDTPIQEAGLVDSSVSITGNSTAAQATGNRALSAVSLNGNLSGGIASSQMNIASVSASSAENLSLRTLPGSDITGSSVDIAGNASAALARGNVAENRIDVAWSRDSFLPVSGVADRFSANAVAPVSLVNVQSNYGPINAVVTGSALVPLNQTNTTVDASRLTIGGNTSTATAYGNGASNSINTAPGFQPSISMVSSQHNYAPVSAVASGTPIGMAVGSVRNATLTVANNAISASAYGNIVTNTVQVTR